MPWSTPTLREVRSLVRDSIRGSLPGADATIPNSVLRVMADAQGALCHLTLQYIDWLALQLIPDTAETEWLDRHGNIWLVNADGTTGRKLATLAEGMVAFTGDAGTLVSIGTRIGATAGVEYETLADLIIAADVATPVAVRALDPGSAGNLDAGTELSLLSGDITGAITSIFVVNLTGGTDDETDDQLRFRVLKRIREPPMGGAKSDYEKWALAVPGVTRAWCGPLEMGMGTVTIRFMCDDLRADNDGFPQAQDIAAVEDYLDTVRPVAVKDIFVVAPLKHFIDVHITNLNPDTPATRGAIEENIRAMLYQLAAPGQTIYAAWKSYAVMNTPGVVSFTLTAAYASDDVMESPGHMAVLRDIYIEEISSIAIPNSPVEG
jgi:uncharacterized phage protein gp47/JayE